MEVQVKELLESIQKDGIDAAEQRSQEIISKAQQEAESLIASAKKEITEMKNKAQEDIRRAEASSHSSLQQAARDVLLSLEKRITNIVQAALLENVSKSMSAAALASLIEKTVLQGFSSTSELSVEIPEAQVKSLLTKLNKSLAAQLEKGLDISPSSAVKGGFIVRQKDGKAYYDFSVQEISLVLSKLVNPHLAAIIKEAAAVKGE